VVGVSPSKFLPFQFKAPKALTLITVSVEFLIKVLRCIIVSFWLFSNNSLSLAYTQQQWPGDVAAFENR